MRKAFHTELTDLGRGLIAMCDLVAEAIRDATRAMLELDLELAEKVIAADHVVDARQRSLDERAVDLLARQSPVATDLRTVVASLRMSSTLERMGDLAEHVALTTRRRYPERVASAEMARIFSEMAALGEEMTRMAGAVIESRDLKLAALVEKKDDRMDALLAEVFELLYSSDWNDTMERAVDLTLIGRFYERIGDHSVSLVKRVAFLVTGEDLDPAVPEVADHD